MNTLELTANETKVLRAIGDDAYAFFFSYFDEGISVNSHTWAEVFTSEIAELLSVSNRAAGGVISSLIKKGIFNAIKSVLVHDIELKLTKIGVEAIKRVRA